MTRLGTNEEEFGIKNKDGEVMMATQEMLGLRGSWGLSTEQGRRRIVVPKHRNTDFP